MEVPGWIFVLLATLSGVLLFCAVAGAVLIVRNWLRLRFYRRLRTPSPSKAGLRHSDGADGFDVLWMQKDSGSFIPLTCTSKVQSESFGSAVRPTLYVHSGRSSPAEEYRMRPIPYHANSVLSSEGDRLRAFERRPTYQDVELARWCSLDDVAFRKYIHTRSFNDSSLPLAQPVSPLTALSDTSYSNRGPSLVSPRGRPNTHKARGDESACSPSGRSKEIESGNQEVYLHSSFLPEIQGSTAHEPVVSYDQTASHEEDGSYPGALTFSLHYDAQRAELRITVRQAFDLPSHDKDPDGTVNCYVNLCLVPEDFLWKRTKLVENSRWPVFDQTFLIPDVLYHKLREYTLCFFIMDVNEQRGERVVGKVLHPLSDLRAGPEIDACVELTPR